MKSLQVLLIGFGMMGKNHYRILRDLEGANLTCIVDINIASLENIKGVEKVSRLEDVVYDNIDYCVISTPSGAHEEAMSWAIKNRIPFLVEKPIATTLSTAKKIYNQLSETAIKAAVGHVERFNPACLKAKELIEAGVIGDVLEIIARRTGPYPNRIKDVGVVTDLATHDIDLVRWLTKSEYRTIFAQTLHTKNSSQESVLLGFGKLSNGILVNHIVNWISPNKDRQVQILGTKGKLVVDTLLSDLTLYEDPVQKVNESSVAILRGVSEGSVNKIAIEKREPLLVEHEVFRDFVRGLKSHPVTIEDGLEAIRVSEVMIRSAESGQVVTV